MPNLTTRHCLAPPNCRRQAPKALQLTGALLALMMGQVLNADAADDPSSGAVALARVSPHAHTVTAVADQLWEWAELGYLETQSSQLLQNSLAAAGFEISAGIGGIPTAFTASYGSGAPVIGIMGEFDALPGISQAAVPYAEALANKSSGHACGHNLFGAGSLGAALAVKDWLVDTGQPGTVRFYGTPAEEGGSGKVYLVRAGAFDDVDIALHWHPGDENSASPSSTLANKSAKFRFKGISSHAAAGPERGRSALDAIEAMNFMVNLLREHVPEETRIHYVITEGGIAPNVVPNFAESFYYVRHPNAGVLATLWDRVIAAAEAAALGTGTTLEYEVIHGNHSVLPNEVLARVAYDHLVALGGPQYDAADQAFAAEIAKTLPDGRYKAGSESVVEPFEVKQSKGSTDVGDVSWNVPTVGLGTATFIPGTGLHTWQAVATGGTPLAHKGTLLAAEVLAATAIDLLSQPDLVAAATAEFNDRRGPDFAYVPLLGDRDPPLDYRR
jgi:aminobenzoyl-glutamate utilization protein B